MPKHIPLNTNIASKNTSFTFYIYGEVLEVIEAHADRHKISRSEQFRLILTDYMRTEGGVQITSDDYITKTPQSAANPNRRKAVMGKRNEVKMVLPLTLAVKFDKFAKKVGLSKSVIMSFAIQNFFKILGVNPKAPAIHL